MACLRGGSVRGLTDLLWGGRGFFGFRMLSLLCAESAAGRLWIVSAALVGVPIVNPFEAQ